MAFIGLNALLDEDKACKEHAPLLRAFKNFLTKTHCEENLLFIEATNAYMRKNNGLSFDDWLSVHDKFIKQDSLKECNFPQSIKNRFEIILRDQRLPSQELLSLARCHVFTLLRDAYTKFQGQSLYTTKANSSDCSCDESFPSPRSALEEEIFFNENSSVSKANDFALTEEEDEDEEEEEEEKNLNYEQLKRLNLSRTSSLLSDTSFSSREASVLSQFPQKISPSETSTDPSGNPSASRTKQRAISNSISQTNEPHNAASGIRRLHRYSLSSTRTSSTLSSSTSTSTNSSQKLSKIVNKLKFARSSSTSSGGISGPHAWHRTSEN